MTRKAKEFIEFQTRNPGWFRVAVLHNDCGPRMAEEGFEVPSQSDDVKQAFEKLWLYIEHLQDELSEVSWL